MSPHQRLGDIKHTTCFINTVRNENLFQILYVFSDRGFITEVAMDIKNYTSKELILIVLRGLL